MGEKTITLPLVLVQKLATFLAQRPYAEVAQILRELEDATRPQLQKDSASDTAESK